MSLSERAQKAQVVTVEINTWCHWRCHRCHKAFAPDEYDQMLRHDCPARASEMDEWIVVNQTIFSGGGILDMKDIRTFVGKKVPRPGEPGESRGSPGDLESR